MRSDDRGGEARNDGWNEPAPQAGQAAGRRCGREAKVPADQLVGGVGEPTATELMNELQASGGTNNKVLSDLQVRFTGLVMNELRQAGIRWDVADDLFCTVWDRVWMTSRRPIGTKGAWNTGNARHTSDPFVPWLKRVAHNTAIDWHRRRRSDRRKQNEFHDFVKRSGAGWLDERGEWHDESQPEASSSRQRAKKTGDGTPPAEKRSKDLPTVTRREAAACREQVAKVVAALDERQRAVLELNAEGIKNVEIGTLVGCSKGEASRRLTAARKTAIERLTGRGEATASKK
jgi:RNA polymerase sigma factor (sigma-70 family)